MSDEATPDNVERTAEDDARSGADVMDDYGTGYSSMSNLRRYPFDKVEIDRSFVAALGEDPVAEVIIDSALALGKSLGLTVVIEGVESEQQRARLAGKAPDLFQGFLFGRPEPIPAPFVTSHNVIHLAHAPKPVLTLR